jgi:hypothetical protein
MQFSDSAIEIMYSYLILTAFLGTFFALTGQGLFGSSFPANPFTATTFTYENTCAEGNWICQATYNFASGLALLNIPFQIINYMWAIFIFFMTSPTLIWLGALFIPAGIILLVLIAPAIARVTELIIQLLQAIANAIPF